MHPLFLGLTRPARYLGLPLGYVTLWAGGHVVLYVYTQSLWTVVPAIVSYIVLRLMAEREPRALELLVIRTRQTPPARNRRIWGGDSYHG